MTTTSSSSSSSSSLPYQVGDHIWVSRANGGIRHHAIVATRGNDPRYVEVIEFGVFSGLNGMKRQMLGSTSKSEGSVRYHRINVTKDIWNIIEYNNNTNNNESKDDDDAVGADDDTNDDQNNNNNNKKDTRKRKAHRRMTKRTTDETSSSIIALREPSQVVEAAFFLLEHQDRVLPPYHITHCNCECVARWCKTGSFTSGQAETFYKAASRGAAMAIPVTFLWSPLMIATPVLAAMSMTARGRKNKAMMEWQDTQRILEQEFEKYQKASIHLTLPEPEEGLYYVEEGVELLFSK